MFRVVARLAALAMLGVLGLAGCGGGAGTAENPNTQPPNAGPNYTGPAPATADIQAFRVNFWENVRGADRCGNCHNAGGQAPQFARSDDVNQAYQQANGVVNRDNPVAVARSSPKSAADTTAGAAIRPRAPAISRAGFRTGWVPPAPAASRFS